MSDEAKKFDKSLADDFIGSLINVHIGQRTCPYCGKQTCAYQDRETHHEYFYKCVDCQSKWDVVSSSHLGYTFVPEGSK